VLVDASQALLVAILPIGFFAVGATLAENAEHGELPMPPPLTRPVAVAVAARLALAPALLMLLAAPLIDLPAAYRLMAAMPSGMPMPRLTTLLGFSSKAARRAMIFRSESGIGASEPARMRISPLKAGL